MSDWSRISDETDCSVLLCASKDGDSGMPRFLIALITALTITGCNTPQGTSSAISLASAQYESGKFDQARRVAQPLLTSTSPESDQAAWIIGLCDYRQKRMQQARKQFRFVASGSDRALSAQARVMLAQIDLADGKPSLCLASLDRAWSNLPQQYRRRASEIGVAAAKTLGDTKAEAQWLDRMPSAPTRTTPELASLRERFTLQLGAYRSKSSAEKLKANIDQSHSGLGQARIRTRTDRRGDKLYLVQIGSFSTRSAAKAARGRIPGQESVVVAQ